MTQIEDAWPTAWSGNGIIDCGESGRMTLSVEVEDGAFDVARNNLERILERWPTLWPEILSIAQRMLDEVQHPLKVASPWAFIQICIPSKIISGDVEWSVAIKYREYDGDWVVTLNGWTPDPDESRPYF
ncbi:MAG: hypothetical protein QM755_10235 [Luteolibacter sp.]